MSSTRLTLYICDFLLLFVVFPHVALSLCSNIFSRFSVKEEMSVVTFEWTVKSFYYSMFFPIYLHSLFNSLLQKENSATTLFFLGPIVWNLSHLYQEFFKDHFCNLYISPQSYTFSSVQCCNMFEPYSLLLGWLIRTKS